MAARLTNDRRFPRRYGVTGRLSDSGHRLIVAYDVRQALADHPEDAAQATVCPITFASGLSSRSDGGSNSTLLPAEVFQPSPPIDFDVAHAALSGNGQLLALGGYDAQGGFCCCELSCAASTWLRMSPLVIF